MRFVLREGPLVLLSGLAYIFGWLTHWIPLRFARALALRSLRRDASRDQPAMRTIVFGLAAVVAWYILQFAALSFLIGPLGAVLWLLLTFVSAHALRLRSGRLRRALRRARTFLALRSNGALQDRLIAEIETLVGEAVSLEQALLHESSARA
jgi:hypothetical protein